MLMVKSFSRLVIIKQATKSICKSRHPRMLQTSTSDAVLLKRCFRRACLSAAGIVRAHKSTQIKVSLLLLKLGRDAGTSPSSCSFVLESPLLNSRSSRERLLDHGSNNFSSSHLLKNRLLQLHRILRTFPN